MKDWTGNSRSIYSNHGASNHSEGERQSVDYYATPPGAVEMLCELENFNNNILEPCAGGGHVVEVLKSKGYQVTSNDLYYHDYPLDTQMDYLTEIGSWHGDIITNPPYKFAQQFVEHSLDIIPNGSKVAMFLKLTFLEGKARKSLFETNQLQTVYVSSSRLNCGMNGEFTGTSAVAYAWFVWVKGYNGSPSIKWFN